MKEKVLAAHRNKLLTVLMPEANRKDLDELPPEVVSEMNFLFADSVKAALPHLFPHLYEQNPPDKPARKRAPAKRGDKKTGKQEKN